MFWSVRMKPNFRIPNYKMLSQFICQHTIIFFFLFIDFTILASSSRVSTVSYSNECASIVPEATPTVFAEFTFPSLRSSTTYYTGGDKILGQKSSLDYYGRYLTFTTRNILATSINGIYKIDASLRFRTNDMFQSFRNSSYGRSSYRRNRGGLIFELHGFWSESSGKSCLVGSASWYSQKGEPLHLDAVLKLNYVKNSTISTSLVSGKLESLKTPNDDSYFEPISILAFPQINQYEYKLISEEIAGGCSGGVDISQNSLLGLHPNGICSMFSRRSNTYKLEHASTPLDGGIGYMPPFMSLYAIQCSEIGNKLRFLIQLINSSYVGYGQMFDPNTTLIGEGWWDGNRNQLCIVACRILDSSDSLGNAHVGDCSVRLSLRYPAIWSIRNTVRAVGQFWTNKTSTNVGYFQNIKFQSSDDSMEGVPGLKYEYTEMDRVRILCPAKPVKKGERYPDGHSYDMRFDMSVKTSNGDFGWGYAVPISIGDELYERYSTMVSDSSWVGVAEIAEPEVEVNNIPVNVSYKISLYPNSSPFSSSLNLSFNNANGPVEISAEGVYDAGTGYLCMVGCRNVGSNSQNSRNDALDCEILVNLQFPREKGKNGGFIKGSIESLRKKSDPLFFEHLNISSTAFSSTEAKQSIWRMDLEITMVLISNTLACVFVGLQLYYVKRYPNGLPFISLVMLVILTLGHMIPLVLNFEAIFLENHNRQNVLVGSSGWLEVNEVIVRVVTMVAFLLQFRLLQLAWTARSGDANQSGTRVSEKKALFVSLPLYILGGLIAFLVNWKKNLRLVGYQRTPLLGDLRSYAGLVLDGFLFPQILLNIFQKSRESALSPSFYIGTTSVRLVPHAYDLYRGHNYVPAHVNGSYIYANPSADFYSAAWDVIIPCAGLLFAGTIFLQQRYGGRCILPSRFRELELYEKVPVVSTE